MRLRITTRKAQILRKNLVIPPNLPLKKGGIPPYQRGMKGVVILLFFFLGESALLGESPEAT